MRYTIKMAYNRMAREARDTNTRPFISVEKKSNNKYAFIIISSVATVHVTTCIKEKFKTFSN
jgi:hypothetical protein